MLLIYDKRLLIKSFCGIPKAPRRGELIGGLNLKSSSGYPGYKVVSYWFSSWDLHPVGN